MNKCKNAVYIPQTNTSWYHSEVQTLQIFVSYTLSRSTWLSTWKKEKEKMKSHTHMADFLQEYALTLFIPAQSCSSSACACWVSSLWAGLLMPTRLKPALIGQCINQWPINQYWKNNFFFLQEFSIIHLTFYALNKVYGAHFFLLQVNFLPVR